MVVGFEHTLNQNKFDSILKLENMFPVVFFFLIQWLWSENMVNLRSSELDAIVVCAFVPITPKTETATIMKTTTKNTILTIIVCRKKMRNSWKVFAMFIIDFCVFFFISYAILNLQRKPQLPNWRRNLIITRIQGGV